MKYCICYYTFIPLRSEPSEKSEMVSQILFGELVEIQEEKNYKDFCFEKTYLTIIPDGVIVNHFILYQLRKKTILIRTEFI